MWFLACCSDGVASVNDGAAGSQKWKLKGGLGSLARHLALQLVPGSLYLSCPVVSVHGWDGRAASGMVTVETANGLVFRAQRVVCSLPPVCAAEVAFVPALPSVKSDFLRGYYPGMAVKTIALYKTPFWLQGSGSVAGPSFHDGLCTNIFHTTADGMPGLVGLIVGDKARQWLHWSPEERKMRLLQQYQAVYGTPAALHPVAFLSTEWVREAYSKGCFAGVAPPGLITRVKDAVRAPMGRLFWAGTETSTSWPGYFEGALASAERVASEVLASLSTAKL